MTTQLTEAGQKLADVLVKAGLIYPSSSPRQYEVGIREGVDVGPALNTAAQILLTPEGAGLRIVFDGPPGPNGGRFVEVENASGHSVNVGQWCQRSDGLWTLSLPASTDGAGLRPALERALGTLEGIAHDVESCAWLDDQGPDGTLEVIRAALAPKTSVPGSDAGMREAAKEKDSDYDLVAEWLDWNLTRKGDVYVADSASIHCLRKLIEEQIEMSVSDALAPQPPKAEMPAGVQAPVYLKDIAAEVDASLAPAARAGDGVEYPHLPLRILETEDQHGVRCPILIADAADNDIAEFYHSEQASVGQSYDQALTLARRLVTLTSAPAANGEGA